MVRLMGSLAVHEVLKVHILVPGPSCRGAPVVEIPSSSVG